MPKSSTAINYEWRAKQTGSNFLFLQICHLSSCLLTPYLQSEITSYINS